MPPRNTQINRTSAKKLNAQDKREQAVELRKRRMSYAEIGKEIGVSRQRACKMVFEEMEKAAAERTKQAGVLIDIELAELDAAAEEAWQHVREGSESAIDRVLRINESRRKLLGLDGALKVEHSGMGVVIIDNIVRPIEEEK